MHKVRFSSFFMSLSFWSHYFMYSSSTDEPHDQCTAQAALRKWSHRSLSLIWFIFKTPTSSRGYRYWILGPNV